MLLGIEWDLGMPGPVAVAIFDQVGRDGVKPSREFLAEVEFRPLPINANECLLGQIGGIVFVLQTADEVVEQFPAVTIHQVVQRGILAGREAAHVGKVKFIEASVPLAWLVPFVGRAVHSLTSTEKLLLPQRCGPSHEWSSWDYFFLFFSCFSAFSSCLMYFALSFLKSSKQPTQQSLISRPS